jgi:hypothetical protein
MFHFHASANSQVAMLAYCHERITSLPTARPDTQFVFSDGSVRRIGAEQPPLGGTLTAGAKAGRFAGLSLACLSGFKHLAGWELLEMCRKTYVSSTLRIGVSFPIPTIVVTTRRLIVAWRGAWDSIPVNLCEGHMRIDKAQEVFGIAKGFAFH